MCLYLHISIYLYLSISLYLYILILCVIPKKHLCYDSPFLPPVSVSGIGTQISKNDIAAAQELSHCFSFFIVVPLCS